MPTLHDVATLAGVSTATVSKVLSNTPYFSDTTREKVLQAVETLGYRPNLAARALSSGKTNIIAVVFPFVYDAIFQDPFVTRVFEGIEAICTEQGYNLLLSTPRLNNQKPDEHYLRLLQSGYIEGLIAIDNITPVSFAQLAEERNVPAVVLGHHKGQFRVQSDNISGGNLLMDTILKHGHRNIGVIGDQSRENIALQERMQGLLQVYQEAAIGAEIPMAESDLSFEGGARVTKTLLEDHPDLTVIVGLNDRMAIGAMHQLQCMGRRVPEDVSVVGYDDIPMAATTQPRLTTINQKPIELGRSAAELLLKRLNDNAQPDNVVIRPSLVLRESLATRR